VVQIHLGPPAPDTASGAVAQLVERQLCKLDVVGSTPISSTSLCADLGSARAAPGRAANWHSDNRIRRVRRASHSEVFAGFRSPKGLDLDLERGVARAERLGRPEFWVTKLLRACGGCLGSRRRRRTWVAAISYGEPLTRLRSVDFRMGKPTAGNTAVSLGESIAVGGKPGEVKHLSTRRKRKQAAIPLVVASESGTA
jgi:hypothetical protein